MEIVWEEPHQARRLSSKLGNPSGLVIKKESTALASTDQVIQEGKNIKETA